jgi:hypothetical protein
MRVGLFGLVMLLAIASVGTLDGWSRSAEAGKPELLIDQTTLINDQGDCWLLIEWSGLPGGRQMHINTQLMTTGGNVLLKQAAVRQDEGQLLLNYGEVSGVSGVEIYFSDNRFRELGRTSVAGPCS